MNRGTGIAAGVVLGFAVLAGAAFWLLREPAVPVTAAPTALGSKPVPPASGLPGVPGAPVPLDANAAAPSGAPWNLSGSAATSAAPAPGEAGRAAAPTMEQIQSRLLAIVASKQPNLAELDGVMADLEKVSGRSVVGGVDLAAVRANLARANRMQAIALEMQTLAAAAPGPENAALLQARVSELQELQKGLRPVTIPTPTPAVR